MTAQTGPTVVSRRDFNRQVAKAVAAGGGASVAVSAVSTIARGEHKSKTPDHVDDPVFDEALLESYKPKLITGDLDVEPSAIAGFIVRSSEHETTALTYWTEYPVQLGATGYESHLGDREPFTVLLANEGTTDEYIDRVICSGYHWLALEENEPPTDTGDHDGRPRAYVAPKYHHYSLDTARSDPRSGDELPLKDLSSRLPRWLDDRDFHDALSENWRDQGSPAYNPWLMEDKASWWRKEGLSNYEEGVRKAWLFFGIRGADRSDLG
jgi:hypothetical protein